MNRQEVEDISELQVRRYFDTYLNDVFPEQVERCVSGHNYHPDAHGGVEKKVNRMLWIMLGAGAVCGIGGFSAGFGLKQLIALLGAGG